MFASSTCPVTVIVLSPPATRRFLAISGCERPWSCKGISKEDAYRPRSALTNPYCASATALARAGASAISASSSGSPLRYAWGSLTRAAEKRATTIDDSKKPIAASNRLFWPGGGRIRRFEVGKLFNCPGSISQGRSEERRVGKDG